MNISSNRPFLAPGLTSRAKDTSNALLEILASGDYPRYPYSRFIEAVWTDAKQRKQASGALFELLVSACLNDAGVRTFYRHGRLLGSPMVEFDLLIWSAFDSSPWCIQLTSSLRERYKLADLQAFRVKSSYPNAIVTLLTMDQEDASRRTNTDYESLDELIYCGSPVFDSFIQRMAHSGSGSCPEIVDFKKTQMVTFNP